MFLNRCMHSLDKGTYYAALCRLEISCFGPLPNLLNIVSLIANIIEIKLIPGPSLQSLSPSAVPNGIGLVSVAICFHKQLVAGDPHHNHIAP